MKKPLLENYGLNQEKYSKISKYDSLEKKLYWGPWLNVPIILHGIFYYFVFLKYFELNTLADKLLAGFIAITVPNLVIIFAVIIGARILGFILTILNYSDTKKVQKYESHLYKYEAWFRRTQEEFWKSLDGKQFEIEIKKLFEKLGYTVQLTGKSGDEGIDLLIEKNHQATIVQCKAHKKAVGPAVAREMYGVMKDKKIDNSMVVSLSGFTSGFYDFVKGKNIQSVELNSIIRMQKKVLE